MSKYNTILFDLDHTLWDYESNSRETLAELYTHYDLKSLGIADENIFIERFEKVNQAMWDKYDHGEIDRAYITNYRFAFIFESFSIFNQPLSLRLSSEYISQCPKKGKLLPHAINLLDYLTGNFKLGVITNGFQDVQHTKLKFAGILDYFTEVVTSDHTGWRKPSREIFDHTLQIMSSKHDETLMVGDNLITDIGGARKALIDTVYYNPKEKPHQQQVSYEISCLSELKNII